MVLHRGCMGLGVLSCGEEVKKRAVVQAGVCCALPRGAGVPQLGFGGSRSGLTHETTEQASRCEQQVSNKGDAWKQTHPLLQRPVMNEKPGSGGNPIDATTCASNRHICIRPKRGPMTSTHNSKLTSHAAALNVRKLAAQMVRASGRNRDVQGVQHTPCTPGGHFCYLLPLTNIPSVHRCLTRRVNPSCIQTS